MDSNESDPIYLDSSSEDESAVQYVGEVRQPMAPVTERIVGGSYSQYYGDRSRRQPVNPIFEQFHDFGSAPSYRRGNATSADAPASGARDLASLFRPPVDIMESHNWDALLRAADEKKRWLLVNVQDPSEFASQVLNRDCWSNEALKNFIKSNFLFWQTYVNNTDGRRVVGYYDLKKFPSVFIVDPRTHEKVHVLTEKPSDMMDDLADFCERYPTFTDYDIAFRAKMAVH